MPNKHKNAIFSNFYQLSNFLRKKLLLKDLLKMYQIKHQGNFYNLPVSTTKSDEILDRLKSILHDENQEFILSFNNIFLSRKVNYNLLEIGYSPQEEIDVKALVNNKAFFNVVDFDFSFL